ncbi:MAG: hypothetical protein QGH60_11630 [Phycisphaerae bacterium]|nr:hypothetical protein [Phycisphaerae bacterium]
MKSIRLYTAVCIAAVLAFSAAAGAQSDEMIPLTIDTDGHVEDIPFDLDKPAAVSIQAFFPPAELGTIKFVVTDAAGEAVDIAPPKILAPGSYSVAVSASGASPDSFSVKIRTFEPVDPYEPNDTRETASRIELPLRTVIRVDSGKDNLDWFKFSVDQAYVLSVHLRSRGGAIKFKVLDAEGKSVYETTSSWDSAGARYAPLTAGEYYLAIGPGGSSTPVEMELSLYDPAGVGDKGGFIAVGMKEGSPALKQLMLIANTTGKGLVETVSPEIMKAELLEAVKEKPVEIATKGGRGWVTWLVILLIPAVGGGVGFWMRRRFKERNDTPPAETSADSEDPAE